MRDFLRHFRLLPIAVRSVLLTIALSRTATFLQMFLVLYLTDVFRLANTESTKAMGLLGAGGILGAFLGGWATDRWGSRRTIIVGYLANSLAVLLFLLQRDLIALFVVVFFYGITFDFVRPAAATLISRYLTGPLLVKTYSLFHMSINLGWIVGPLIASLLFGFGFHILFGWNVVIVAVCAWMAWRWICDCTIPSDTSDTKEGEGSSAPATTATFHIAPFCLAMVIQATMQVFIVQSFVSLPLYVRDTLHLPVWCYNLMLSWNAIGCVLLAYGLSSFMSRWPLFLATGCGIFVYGLGNAFYGIATNLIGLLAAETILTIGEAMTFAVFQGLLVQLSPVHMRGKLFGIAHGIAGGSAILAPVATGFLLQVVDFHTLWLFMGGLGCLAFIAALIGHQILRQNSPVMERAAMTPSNTLL